MRLVAAPRRADGTYRAGVEIVMTPGSHTYWKQPGEAGVPPVFAFNGSINVAQANVLFPAPTRILEDGIEAFGYTDRVVFPVVVLPADLSKAAVLTVDVSYAVCNKICIPAHGTASLRLTPDGPGLDEATLRAALDRVPAPIGSEAGFLELDRDRAAAKPTWTLTWSGTPAVEDVFPVAPDGYFFQTKKLGPGRFSLTAEQVVDNPKTTKVPVSLTLAREKASLVATESLDLAAPTR